jgi:hypothetical protein
VRRHDDPRAGSVRLEQLAPHGTDRDGPAEHRPGRGGAEAHHDVGSDDRQLGLEPRVARRDVPDARLLVDPTLAAHRVAEVLDRVGDVDRRPIDTGPVERVDQHPARGSHERLARLVLLVTRLLTDQHEPRAGRPA